MSSIASQQVDIDSQQMIGDMQQEENSELQKVGDWATAVDKQFVPTQVAAGQQQSPLHEHSNQENAQQQRESIELNHQQSRQSSGGEADLEQHQSTDLQSQQQSREQYIQALTTYCNPFLTIQNKPPEYSGTYDQIQLNELPDLVIGDDQLEDTIPVGPADILQGQLSNGMTYYIRENGRPSERVVVSLTANVGSVLEEEHERGLAHFIEHLAFRGTKNFPNHRIVETLEAIGAPFGADQNAVTSMDSTTFTFSLPYAPNNDSQDMLETVLYYLADIVCNIRCSTEDITAERGVILEEMRESEQSGMRVGKFAVQTIFKGTPYADRLPIGLESVIKECDEQRVRSFYEKWYHPSVTAVVIVGDVNKLDVFDKVERILGAITPTNATPTLPPPAPLPTPSSTPIIQLLSDKETPSSVCSVQFVRPVRAVITVQDLLDSQAEMLLFTILNRRLFKLSRIQHRPFNACQFDMSDMTQSHRLLGFNAEFEPKQGLKTVQALLTEALRLRIHGINQDEFDQAINQSLSEVRAMWLGRAQEKHGLLVEEYVTHFQRKECVLHRGAEAVLVQAAFKRIKIEDVQQCIHQLDITKGLMIQIFESKKYYTEAQVQQIVSQVQQLEHEGTVAPPEALQPIDYNITTEQELGPPGTVLQTTPLPHLKARELLLSNGMRVVTLPTTCDADVIQMMCFAFGGTTEIPYKHYANALTCNSLASVCGPFGINPEKLVDSLAGVRMAFDGQVSSHVRNVEVEVSPEHFEIALQLIWRLFTTEIQPDEMQMGYLMNVTKQYIVGQARDPLVRYSSIVEDINTGKPAYLRSLTVKDVSSVDPNVALNIYSNAFKHPQHFTLILVGSLPSTASLTASLNKYMGSIPNTGKTVEYCGDQEGIAQFTRKADERDLHVMNIDDAFNWDIQCGMQRKIHAVFPTKPVEHKMYAMMLTPLSIITVTFPAVLSRDNHLLEQIKLLVLAQELSQLVLKSIRFTMGETYSPQVDSSVTELSADQSRPVKGSLIIQLKCDPQSTEKCKIALLECVQQLQQKLVQKSEADSIIAHFRSNLKLLKDDNSYWVEQVYSEYDNPRRIFEGLSPDDLYHQKMQTIEEVLNTTTPQTIQDAARKLLPYPCTNQYTVVTLLPRFQWAFSAARVVQQHPVAAASAVLVLTTAAIAVLRLTRS